MPAAPYESRPVAHAVISPDGRYVAALWQRGASNAGYHYLGCAKTFALMGKAFAQANLELLQDQRRQ